MGREEININLRDGEWKFNGVTHDRQIVRAIVFDGDGYFYFVRVDRDDDFGKAVCIETAGGGVENGEDLEIAIHRELKEELGATVDVICKIGVVSDYYNLIKRHNINNYYLCRVESFGEKHMTDDEIQPDEEYLMSGNKISVKTLDLNTDFSHIAASLDQIVADHFGIIGRVE